MREIRDKSIAEITIGNDIIIEKVLKMGAYIFDVIFDVTCVMDKLDDHIIDNNNHKHFPDEEGNFMVIVY